MGIETEGTGSKGLGSFFVLLEAAEGFTALRRGRGHNKFSSADRRHKRGRVVKTSLLKEKTSTTKYN